MIECKLVSPKTQTAHGPLCALGHFLTREGVLEPLSDVRIAQKTVEHSPQQKLLDALLGILSGAKALYETNARVRPDLPLQRAFGRARCADQSTIQRTLNAFTRQSVDQLREAIESIYRTNSPIFSHDFEDEMLVLEVDLTGMRASAKAEGATKGYFSGERNATGRQLARVGAPQYGEVPFEKLHPGNTNSCEVLKETMGEVERVLGLEGRAKRQRTLVRIDGGFGTDANLNWLCWRGYQFVAKGYGGRRASGLANSVPEGGWREGPTEGQKLGVPASPHRYARKTETVVRRWFDGKGKPHTDYLVTTLVELDPPRIAKLYDGRAGTEADIKGDKRGLGIEKRRKKSLCAQEALALLAQLAHNLLAWFRRWFLAGTAAGGLGTERLVREVLAMPAEVRAGRRGKKVRLSLPTLHPWARAVAEGVSARFPPNGWRTIWRQS